MVGRQKRSILHLGIVLAVLAVMALALTGCFGGGGVATGSVDGYVFKPEGRASGGLKIVYTLTPPEGYVACEGASVTVTGSSNTATTASNGYFRIDGVSPGYRTVTVVYGSYTVQVGVQVTAGRVTPVNELTGTILPKKWTIMVYMCADNNLDSAALEDINEMEMLGSNADVNILVQIDRPDSATGGTGQWKGARRYYIRKDSKPTTITSPVVYWFGQPDTDNEIDMGDPDELSDFVEWATTCYPAEHYMLVLWNHGNGWTIVRSSRITARAICFDDTSDTWLDVDQIRGALQGLPHLRIIGLDACLMQMIEVAYEFRGLADIMVGSEDIEPGDGWEYQDALARVCAYPNTAAWDVAKDIVDAYWTYHGSTTTQSAFKLTYADDVAVKLRDLKDILLGYLTGAEPQATAVRQAMVAARNSLTPYGYVPPPSESYSFYDICDYCDALKNQVDRPDITEPARAAIRSACDAVKAQINLTSMYAKGNGRGLSIYIPPTGTADLNYDWLLFDQDTRWSDLFPYYIAL